MARERYVPLFSSVRGSNKLAGLPDDTVRVFYFLMLAQCDAWGRIDSRPVMLNAEVWPLLGKSPDETRRCVEILEAHDLIERHTDGDRKWIQIPDWEQKAGTVGKSDHRRASQFPGPSDETFIPPKSDTGPTPGQAGPTPGQDRTDTVTPSRARGRTRAGKPEPDLEPEPENKPEPDIVVAGARRGEGNHATRLWDRCWSARRRDPFQWTRAHAVAITQALKAHSDEADFERRVGAFLDSDDVFLRKRQTPSQFVANWHRFDIDAPSTVPLTPRESAVRRSIQIMLNTPSASDAPPSEPPPPQIGDVA